MCESSRQAAIKRLQAIHPEDYHQGCIHSTFSTRMNHACVDRSDRQSC